MIATIIIAAISLSLALIAGALLNPGSFQGEPLHVGDAGCP